MKLKFFFKKWGLLILVTSFYLGFAWWQGYEWRGKITCDWTSEDDARHDAELISAGRHAYGIVWYSHYPNGSVYLLLPFVKEGVPIDWDRMRLLPITISVVSLGIFLWSMLVMARSDWLKVWGLIFGIALIVQPSFFKWQGTLRDFSLNFSLTLILLAVVANDTLFNKWGLWILGFFAGWLGYDFLPSQFFAVITVRFLIYSQNSILRLRKTFFLALYDGVVYASGICCAILGHLIQNALVYNSLSYAQKDLFGAASLRMGIEGENKFYSVYRRDRPFIENVNRFSVPYALLKDFIWGYQSSVTLPPYASPSKWSHTPALLGSVAASIFLTVLLIFRNAANSVKALARNGSVFLGSVIFGVTACSIPWLVLMPYHAAMHACFVARHFLVGFCVIGLMPLLFERRNLLPSQASTLVGRGLMGSFILWSTPIIILALSMLVYFLNK